MLFEDMFMRTIELLAEAERNVALKERLDRQRDWTISSHNETDSGVPKMGNPITITDNSQETHGALVKPKIELRSDLSDLLQRLSVLTAIKDRCAAMASEVAEERRGSRPRKRGAI